MVLGKEIRLIIPLVDCAVSIRVVNSILHICPLLRILFNKSRGRRGCCSPLILDDQLLLLQESLCGILSMLVIANNNFALLLIQIG